MATTWNFKLQTNLTFGPRSLDQILDFVKERQYRSVAVIVDVGVDRNEYWQQFRKHLAALLEVRVYFANTKMEPTYSYLDEIRGQFPADVDCMIGVGGGSTMDIAKALSVLATNPKPALAYRGFGLIENPGIPLILAPSTAGSGSEITPFAVFIETSEKRKFGINSPVYLPVFTVIDPLLTVSCPRSVTLASGMDALTHTLESFVAKKHTPLSRIFSKQAFSYLYNNLPAALRDPQNIELRTKVSFGAYLAGVALFNSAAGPAGVLSYPIGTLFDVTHGLAGSVFLYPIVKFNVDHGYNDYAELYDLIDGAPPLTNSAEVKAKAFLNHFKSFCTDVQIPNSLDSFGVKRSHIPEILTQLKLLWGSVEQNPILVKEEDVVKILTEMCSNAN